VSTNNDTIPDSDSPDVLLTVMIGNSDDKLKQAEWSEFCTEVDDACRGYHKHFAASSDGKQPWQNACWVFEIPADMVGRLKRRLLEIRRKFRQSAIAVVTGNSEFI
jgi:hypothetical protein